MSCLSTSICSMSSRGMSSISSSSYSLPFLPCFSGFSGTGGDGWACSLATILFIFRHATWYRFANKPTSDLSGLISC